MAVVALRNGQQASHRPPPTRSAGARASEAATQGEAAHVQVARGCGAVGRRDRRAYCRGRNGPGGSPQGVGGGEDEEAMPFEEIVEDDYAKHKKEKKGGKKTTRRARRANSDLDSQVLPQQSEEVPEDAEAATRVCNEPALGSPSREASEKERGLADSSAAFTSPWQAGNELEAVFTGLFGALAVDDVLRSSRCCSAWHTVAKTIPRRLTNPRVMDALLSFCLVEVLAVFSDDKLPFPLTATYGEMCAVARSLHSRPAVLDRLMLFLSKHLGSSCDVFPNPQHVMWSLDVKQSSFKSLEKMWHHFHTSRLLGATRQRWFKRMKNSHNTRTCCEWLLIKVNTEHPLLAEHEFLRP
eukprot:TRINITY_DN14249_c0_g2_i1.p1 TRINITY_DN14249_c0_g2~~TRINITY_DN14249_c0_g2_i1.p1  ORF type:complete len:354 (-),score=77.34 TRINITY_DN14249_c0_g2_i1:161-1222(-)